MCGICGIVTSHASVPSAETVRRMMAALRHRGPDEGGSAGMTCARLGCRRLSMIDPEGSHQPIFNEDRSICMVCNGEIYNYRDLRDALELRGHSFATQGDAEAALHAFEEWGTEAFQRLRGMFALAIWEEGEQRLTLARDRSGIKPLFHVASQASLAFASEPAALLCSDLASTDPDPAAIDAYLSLLYIPAPLTGFRSMRKLPPGSFLRWHGGTSTIEPFWTPPAQLHPAPSPREAAEALTSHLREAVRLHLQSDAPIAFFLSGGLDSSAVVALAAAEQSAPIRTFTAGFDQPSHDERPWARIVAHRFGCEHEELEIRPDAAACLPRVVAAFGEPFGDASAIPSFHLSQAAAQAGVKGILSGDGGDELFGGYEWTRRQRLLERLRLVPLPLRRAAAAAMARHRDRPSRGGQAARFLLDSTHTAMDGYLRRISCMHQNAKPDLYGPALRPHLDDDPVRALLDPFFDTAPPHDPVDAMLRADYALYLPGDDLCKVDRMTMQHSLEARVPLLDPNVVDFALALPSRLKIRGGVSKAVLKLAAQSWLPPEILRQRKQGFSPPVARWMREDLRNPIDRLLPAGIAVRNGFLESKPLQAMIDRHRTGAADHGHALWAVLVLEVWLRLIDRNALSPDVNAPLEDL